MSEFDKEAEREKLREKYERDKQNRESTERMSDLLLKGATMTNSHCGTCGDPIFRHEGQQFCPTCQEVVGEDEGEQSQTTPQDVSASGPETEGVGGVEPDEPADATDSVDADATPEPTSPSPSQPPVPSENELPDTARARDGTTGVPDTTTPPATDVQPQQQERVSDVDGESLANARASLTRTVTRLAQQAEASEDLERARAYLAATEEAADALAAVKRADK
ncbi:Sjogren's syndrome/scleroderma autoantigen 1 family protein [Halorientalis brevis]|uniref:Sjogren's syndrome/scleroderma autoantigen 1 family protein n=1 Tax=Halorientalis brevis TaxID=1126241 RepID=A0ABD6CAN2_9EURY|nr:Sjogren's syndrome/scleroderma autoantigen 1 family protein [Halorientalis brevis]